MATSMAFPSPWAAFPLSLLLGNTGTLHGSGSSMSSEKASDPLPLRLSHNARFLSFTVLTPIYNLLVCLFFIFHCSMASSITLGTWEGLKNSLRNWMCETIWNSVKYAINGRWLPPTPGRKHSVGNSASLVSRTFPLWLLLPALTLLFPPHTSHGCCPLLSVPWCLTRSPDDSCLIPLIPRKPTLRKNRFRSPICIIILFLIV